MLLVFSVVAFVAVNVVGTILIPYQVLIYSY